MALVLREEFPEVDLGKLLAMCIVHDLGEAIGGDVPAPEQARRRAEDPGATKATQEREDLLTLLAPLSASLRQTITALWDEYEAAASPEARVAKALDKLETILQHTQGANPRDFDYRFNLGYGRAFTDNHPAIVRLRAVLDRETERLAELNAPPQPGKPY
jgi:putative hydrolase of HD superfamily